MRHAPLLLLLILAGCVGGPSETSGPADFHSGALVVGVITDDELRPLPQAIVTLAGTSRTATTDAEGGFELPDVPPGQWVLSAEKDGHEPVERELHVDEGAEVELQLRLKRLAATQPFVETLIYRGHYQCAHEIPIWTGDCMILYEAATGQKDPYTNETFHFRAPIGTGWDSVVLELEWKQGANNQLDGMRAYLENGNGTTVGHSYKVARAEGPVSPIKTVLHRGEPHPRADTYPDSKTKAFIPDQGELAQIRVFPRGKFYEQTSQICDGGGRCLLGVGAGLGIDFHVYATVFYHHRASTEFSAIPDR